MKNSKLPKTDSIQELSAFWDRHDLTDFEEELEEVPEPIFVRGSEFKVRLGEREALQVHQVASAEGITDQELIQSWVLEKLANYSS